MKASKLAETIKSDNLLSDEIWDLITDYARIKANEQKTLIRNSMPGRWDTDEFSSYQLNKIDNIIINSPTPKFE